MKSANQTEREVLEALRKAGEQMTQEQKRQQQISFIMGTLDSDSTIDRNYVEAAIEKMYGNLSGS